MYILQPWMCILLLDAPEDVPPTINNTYPPLLHVCKVQARILTGSLCSPEVGWRYAWMLGCLAYWTLYLHKKTGVILVHEGKGTANVVCVYIPNKLRSLHLSVPEEFPMLCSLGTCGGSGVSGMLVCHSCARRRELLPRMRARALPIRRWCTTPTSSCLCMRATCLTL